MKTLKHGLLLTSIMLSGSVFPCSIDGKDGILPRNNMRVPVNAKVQSGITEEGFNAVIDKVETVYAPIISSFGAELSVVRNWKDDTVNAYAEQSGKKWKVSMFGGLARHQTITEDGFALVVCHEIGHHIAGAPLYSWKSGWASTEGQSDYFATTKCLRRSWINDDNKAIVEAMTIPDQVLRACGKTTRFRKTEDYYICARGAMAGMSVAKLFASFGGSQPKFETPDTKVVTKTNESHPASQCRLDTYFAGAVCPVAFSEDFSRDGEVAGACHGSLGHTTGTRPLCWFKPAVAQ